MSKKIVYVGHQISGDVENNLKEVAAWVRFLRLHFPDHVFIAPYFLYCHSFDDNNPEERKIGQEMDKAVMEKAADELWLVGPKFSSGMKDEKLEMEMLCRPIINLIGLTRDQVDGIKYEVSLYNG